MVAGVEAEVLEAGGCGHDGEARGSAPAGALIWVNPVVEPKTVKNRVHLDVVGDSTALQAAGATLLRARDAEIGWDVLADPEGNEFCCFAAE